MADNYMRARGYTLATPTITPDGTIETLGDIIYIVAETAVRETENGSWTEEQAKKFFTTGMDATLTLTLARMLGYSQ